MPKIKKSFMTAASVTGVIASALIDSRDSARIREIDEEIKKLQDERDEIRSRMINPPKA